MRIATKKTVGELIKELQKYPENQLLVSDGSDGGYGSEFKKGVRVVPFTVLTKGYADLYRHWPQLKEALYVGGEGLRGV